VALLTAADYSVMVKGLDKQCFADDQPDGAKGLESRVFADLEKLGFPPSTVAKLEVGRYCADEMSAIAKLGFMRVHEQELKAKERHAKEKGKAVAQKVTEGLGKVKTAMGASTRVSGVAAASQRRRVRAPAASVLCAARAPQCAAAPSPCPHRRTGRGACPRSVIGRGRAS
jgi:hypothetical protein